MIVSLSVDITLTVSFFYLLLSLRFLLLTRLRLMSGCTEHLSEGQSSLFFSRMRKFKLTYSLCLVFHRMATAQDIGKSVVALCSDNFTFMTGSDVLVDGGEFYFVFSWLKVFGLS